MTIRKTPLHAEHLQLKARMIPFAGFDMPISYDFSSGGMRQEHLHVRQNCGLFDVSHMGEFWLRGKGVLQYLSRITTKDFSSSKDGRAYYSLLLNEKGGIVDDIIVYRLQEDLCWMVVNASNIDKDWRHLQSTATEFEVELENVSEQTALIAIQGPNSEELLKPIFPKLADLPYYGFYSEEGRIIARTGYSGEDGFEIFLRAAEVVDLWRRLISKGIPAIGLGARDTLRMEVGFPLYGQELREDLYAHETLAAFALRNSGPFIGSSSLEKSRRWQPVALLGETPKPMRSGEKILFGGKVVGELTSGTSSPILRKGIGLGLIETSCELEDGRTFMLESGGKQREAKLTSLPFVETKRVKKKVQK